MEPQQVLNRLRNVRPVVLSGHKKTIPSVAWSAEGSYLASCSSDKNIKIWSVEPSGQSKEYLSLTGHSESVTQICWSQRPSTQNLLASCSSDKYVKIWDIRSKKCIQSISTKGDNINITWSAPGEYIAVGNRQDVISLIDARSYKVITEKKFDYEVNELSFDRSGAYLFTASGVSGIGKIEVFKVKNGSLTYKCELNGHTQNCYCVEVDMSGKYLISGAGDAMVALWDLNELMCVRTFPNLDFPARALSISYDSKIVAIGCEDHIVLANLESGEELGTIDFDCGSSSLAWHPSQHILAVAGDDKESKDSMLRVVGVNFPLK